MREKDKVLPLRAQMPRSLLLILLSSEEPLKIQSKEEMTFGGDPPGSI